MVRSRNHLFIILLFVKFIYFAVDSFNQQRSRGFPHQLHNSFSFVKPSSWRTSSSSLYSYGDPDLSTESNLYRKLQEFLRSYDKVIYPEESDIPGVTFLSPVEWAPWMETIWFGNIYDYRSAFFQDVMYSNSKPFKEGALLYKDSYRSLMIALLYQRYKRFDTSSYSLINATFFNVFGVDSLRVGRYKVPLTNEVILCTTDPLTSTEMKRYLNTFNPIKLFASKYFQQKRKRQYVINITDTSSSSTSQLLSGVPTSGKPTKGSSNFLFDSVYLIEYGRLAMSNRVKDPSATIPISPLPIQSLLRSKIEVVNRGMRSERAVLAVPISEANSQYFLENLFQSIFTHLIRDCRMDPKSIRVLFGGDGRLLNDLATEIGVRVAVGNTLSRVLVATDNLLDSSTAAELCSKSSSLVTIGKAEEASSLPSVAIVLSTDKQGGIKGAFGVSVVFSSSSMKGDKNKDAIWFDVSHWLSVLTQMSARQCIEISPVRFLSPIDTTVRSKTGELTTVKGDFPVDDTLVKSLKGQFNFQSLKSFITKSGLIFTVDALGSRLISQTLQTVLKELGVDEEAALLNKPVENLQDFNGLVPDGIPSQNSDSATLFNLPDTYSVSLTDFQNAEAMMEDSEIADEIGMGRTTDDSSTDFSDCPDIGFVFNSDASQCSVLTPGAVLSPSESVNLLSQLSTPSVSTASSSYAGLRFMLGWLTLLSTGSADSILNKQFSR